MVNHRNNQNKLTKQEQATTTAYKMMGEKIEVLEKSLKKTQDQSEAERQEKHELDKKVVLLENKLENNLYIEAFKFIAASGVGFATNYITAGLYSLGLSVGIPSLVVFIVCIVVDKK